MSRLIGMLHSCPMTLIVSLPCDLVLSQAAFRLVRRCKSAQFGAQCIRQWFGSFRNIETFLHMLETAKGPVGLVRADMKDISRYGKSNRVALDFFFLYAHPLNLSVAQKGSSVVAAGHGRDGGGVIVHWASALEASIIPADQYGQPVSARDLIAYESSARRHSCRWWCPPSARLIRGLAS